MVIGTNSMPTGIPSSGCIEERNFILCKQLNCETAWLFQYGCGKYSCEVTQVTLRQGPSDKTVCSTQVLPTPSCSALPLFCREVLGVSAQKMLFNGKRKCTLQTTEELTSRSPAPGPWLAHPHKNEDSKSS